MYIRVGLQVEIEREYKNPCKEASIITCDLIVDPATRLPRLHMMDRVWHCCFGQALQPHNFRLDSCLFLFRISGMSLEQVASGSQEISKVPEHGWINEGGFYRRVLILMPILRVNNNAAEPRLHHITNFTLRPLTSNFGSHTGERAIGHQNTEGPWQVQCSGGSIILQAIWNQSLHAIKGWGVTGGVQGSWAGLGWLGYGPLGGSQGARVVGPSGVGWGGPGGCFINFKQFGIEAFMRPK